MLVMLIIVWSLLTPFVIIYNIIYGRYEENGHDKVSYCVNSSFGTVF